MYISHHGKQKEKLWEFLGKLKSETFTKNENSIVTYTKKGINLFEVFNQDFCVIKPIFFLIHFPMKDDILIEELRNHLKIKKIKVWGA